MFNSHEKRPTRGLDWFGEHFNMKLDGDVTALKSLMGSFLTVILASTIGLFMLVKMWAIVGKFDVDIFSSYHDNEITMEEKFDASQGFFVAAGLTSYDSNEEYEEDPRYGEIVFEHWDWGNEENYGLVGS